MKQLLFILSVLISTSSFGQVKVGTTGDIVPIGNYPALKLGSYQAGSFPVQTLAQRNAILYKVPYMAVYVGDSAKSYRLGNDLTTWTEIIPGITDTTSLHSAITANTTSIATVTPLKTRTYSAFSHVLQHAKERVVKIALYGTSIMNNGNSSMKLFASGLAAELGWSGNQTTRFGEYGGTYDQPIQGWEKQPAFGPALTRMRGKSTSQTLRFDYYMKRYVLRYSTETSGGSFDIYADGVYNQTVNCNGAQSYGNEAVITWPTAGYHYIEIHAPNSGFAYIESQDLCKDDNGIQILDGSLGGSSITQFFQIRTPFGGQVTGIPLTDLGAGVNNYTGIKQSILNFNPQTKPDILVLSYVVNDAGNGMTLYNQYYKPALDSIVDICYKNDVQLAIVIEMGGAYSSPTNVQYNTYNTIRNQLLSYAGTKPNVSVFDWQGKSGMTTTDYNELDRLALRYYTLTVVNNQAQTWTGADYIHPKDAGYELLTDMLFQEAGIKPPARNGEYEYNIIGKGSRTVSGFGTLANTSQSLYADEYAELQGYSTSATNGVGIQNTYRVVGYSRGPYKITASAPEPLWYSAEEENYATAIIDSIKAANTSDQFGNYRTYTSGSPFGIYLPLLSATSPFTVTVVAAPGTTIGVSGRTNDNSAYLPLLLKGNTFTPVGSQGFQNERTDKPEVFHVTYAAYNGNPYFTLQGKIYAVYVTPTIFACIPGKRIDSSKNISPVEMMVGDIQSDKLILNQLYHEVINSKTIEKQLIGKNIYKPLSNGVYGLYSLRNKASGVDFQLLPLVGGTTTGIFNEKYGGYTQTTGNNPWQYSAPNTYSATVAGLTYTASGIVPIGASNGFTIRLNNNAGVEYGLQSDGSWISTGSTQPYNFASNMLGKAVAVTFTMPNSTLFSSYNFTFNIQIGGNGYTGIGKWTLCEGSSATVSTSDVAYTYGTGLTTSGTTITNNLSTGKSGGQNIILGTASGEGGVINSTSNATKGYTRIDQAVIVDGNLNRVGINTYPSNPAYTLDVKGTAQIGVPGSLNGDLKVANLISAVNGNAGSSEVMATTSGNNNTAYLALQNTATSGYEWRFMLGGNNWDNAGGSGPNEGNLILKDYITSTTRMIIQKGTSGGISFGTSLPNASAALDIQSTTKGFLTPRMSATQKNAISSPATGLHIYQTDSTEGLRVYTSNGWRKYALERVTAPTVVLGSNITGSVALSSGSTDSKGTVTVTVTGASSLATLNELFTLTFSSAFTSTPTIVYSNASSQSAALEFGATGLYVKNAGTTSFQIATSGSYTTPASATYSFNYHVIQ